MTHQAKAAHRLLISCGCNPVTDPNQPNLYHHESTDMRLVYAPEAEYLPEELMSDTVILVPDDEVGRQVASECKNEVVTLEHFMDFMLYRVYGPECAIHRQLVAKLNLAYRAYEEAKQACDASMAALAVAKEIRALSNSPRFQPAALSLAA